MDDIKELFEDCIAREEKLSAWEHDFIVSIQTQFEANGTLSPKQYDKLSQIWERVT